MHEQPQISGTLSHYGKKGMKWGIRKGYVQRTKGRGNASLAVAKPGNVDLKTRVAYRQLSGAPLMPKAYQAKRGRLMVDHANRIAKGKATINDKLIMYARVHPLDIRRQPENYGRTAKQIREREARPSAKETATKTLKTVNKGINAYGDYRNEVHTNAMLGGFVGAVRGDPYAVQRRDQLNNVERAFKSTGKKAIKKMDTEIKVAELRRAMRNY